MDIDIKTAQTRIGTPDQGVAPSIPSRSQGDAAPVLTGAGVVVVEVSDFEKLLAKLEMEHEDRRQSLCAQRFASALAAMAGKYGNLTAEQSAALATLAEKSAAYERAGAARDAAQAEYDASVVELAVLTEKLEALVKAQTKTPEEREKELRARESQAEESAAAEKADELEDKTKEIEELQAKVAEQQKVVAADRTARDAAEGALDAAGSALTGATRAAMASLDGAQAKTIAGAVRQLAAEIAAAATERTDGDEETAEKANAIIAAMERYAASIEGMRQEELDEMVAKTSADLQALLRLERTLKPGELGEYNEIV